MPLIASEPSGKKSALRFEIDAETRQMLKSYCEFSGNSKLDPVIVGALKLLFKSDAEFGPWLEQQERQQPSGSGSAPAASKTPQPTSKPDAHK